MDAEAIRRALRRIAHEIIERNPELGSVVLAGIPLRGVEIARRLGEIILGIEKVQLEIGVIDVAMHRDDIGKRENLPMVQTSHLPLPLDHRTVIIVDDVLFTGRTCRAAMDAISSFGRPARDSTRRAHRSRPSRIADPRGLRGKEFAHRADGTRPGAVGRNRSRTRLGVAREIGRKTMRRHVPAFLGSARGPRAGEAGPASRTSRTMNAHGFPRISPPPCKDYFGEPPKPARQRRALPNPQNEDALDT